MTQHRFIEEKLIIFGVPFDDLFWIKKLCANSFVEIKVGKYKRFILHGRGVKKGDNLDLTLLIMVMQLADQCVAEEINKHNSNRLEGRVPSADDIVARNIKKRNVLKLSLLAI